MQDLEELDALEFEEEEEDKPKSIGAVLLHRLIFEGLGGKGAKHILFQSITFYTILLVGFAGLYLMFKSTQQIRNGIKNLKKNVGETLRAQHTRRFDLEDYRSSTWI